jgi:hypothetical protein
MVADRQDKVFGKQALGFGAALAPLRRPWPRVGLGVGRHTDRRSRQGAQCGAGSFVQLCAEQSRTQRSGTAFTPFRGRAALTAEDRHRAPLSIGRRQRNT